MTKRPDFELLRTNITCIYDTPVTSPLCQTPSIHIFLLWNSIWDKTSSESLYYVYTHTYTFILHIIHSLIDMP